MATCRSRQRPADDLVDDDPVGRFAVALAAMKLAKQSELDVLGHVLRVRVSAQARNAATDDDVVVLREQVLDRAFLE